MSRGNLQKNQVFSGGWVERGFAALDRDAGFGGHTLYNTRAGASRNLLGAKVYDHFL